MKIKLRALIFLLGLFMFSGFASFVQASHFVGSTITYMNVAPGTYQVTLHVYRDCAGAIASPTENINLNAPGCNAGRTVTLNQTTNRINRNPYCSNIQLNCSSTGMQAFQQVQYQGVVTFTAAEQTCADWVLGYNYGNGTRQQSENVVLPSGMYNEAFLKFGTGLLNSSPQVNLMDDPVPFFCVMQEAQYIFNATDPDCDSLSYELVAPMGSPNTPVTYKPLHVYPDTIINYSPNPPYGNPYNPQIALMPNVGTHYSPTFPLHSYLVNWGSQPIGTVTPIFKLDTNRGILNFQPIYYKMDALSTTTNKYFVTVQIKEWRKINGVMTNIGFIRRDFQFKIVDCSGNKLPHITPPSIPGQPFPIDSIYTVREGSMLNLQFTTSDHDPNDVLSIESDIATVLPGATLNLSTAAKPVGTISWLATLNSSCDHVRYFNIRVADNACPFKGRNDYLLGVRVTRNLLATPEKLNSKADFSVSPNPFAEEVYFSFDQAQARKILIYNLLGQQLDEIPLKTVGLGKQKVQWQNAAKHPAGTYLAKLVLKDRTFQTLKFTKLQ